MGNLNGKNPAVIAAKKIARRMVKDKDYMKQPVEDIISDISIDIQTTLNSEIDSIRNAVNLIGSTYYPIRFH